MADPYARMLLDAAIDAEDQAQDGKAALHPGEAAAEAVVRALLALHRKTWNDDRAYGARQALWCIEERLAELQP
ncbi:hypothetical protein [Herbihabitans rhizosphaerae]|uniref:hypothetical protein n=1 Tax=Herbihabitans rhizosphaerae TaxID=1872711 RepID=UPI00102B2905|nr:hypothetical protein [Herbihabitans rhizosphaerae]